MELTLYNNHSENIKVDKTISKVGDTKCLQNQN